MPSTLRAGTPSRRLATDTWLRRESRFRVACLHVVAPVPVIVSGPYIRVPTHADGSCVPSRLATSAGSLSMPYSTWMLNGIVTSIRSPFFQWREGISAYEPGVKLSAMGLPLSVAVKPSVAQRGTRSLSPKSPSPAVTRIVDACAGHLHSCLMVTPLDFQSRVVGR